MTFAVFPRMSRIALLLGATLLASSPSILAKNYNVGTAAALVAAINDGNFVAGDHTINFTVSSITLTADIPELRAKYTVTGFAPRTTINGAGIFKCFSLSDSGEAASGHDYKAGTQSGGADGSTIQNLVIQNCNSHGISANGHGYTFKNNFIGTNSTGTATSLALRNKGSGISISASRVYTNESNNFLSNLNQQIPTQPLSNAQISAFASQYNTVLANALLGPVTIEGNVLSGNQNHGIDVFSQNLAGVWIKNNKIGTDVTGNLVVPNEQSGISFSGETFGNIIGPDNVISGNLQHGISMQPGAIAMPHFIMGNRIGLAALQVGANVGNGLSGIYVDTHPQDDPNTGMLNPSMIALIIGPSNVIGDNKGAPGSADPDQLGDDQAGIFVTGASAGIKIKGNTIGIAEFPPGTPISSLNYGNAGHGITVTVKDVEIGGSAATDANIIASNGRHGILVKGTGVTGTKILGNYIGVHPGLPNDVTLGNAYDGIHVFGASTSFIGGSGATDFNTIAANGRNGVKLRKSGTGYDNGWGHLLQRNRIYGNGISLSGVGIDHDYAEDAQDPLHSEIPQNYVNLDQSPAWICTGGIGDPIACSGANVPGDAGGTTTIKWTMTSHGPSVPATQYRVEFFKIDGPSVNASSSMTFLGDQIIDTDGATGALIGCPNGLCTASIAAPSAGSGVVMTVTDITQIANVVGGGWFQVVKCIVFASCNVNNTSEFSNVVQAVTVPVNTTTVVTNVNPGTIVYGQPFTATATVTAATGNTAPTGSVTINVNGAACSAALGGAMGLTSSATCSPTPAPGVVGSPYPVTADYAGNAQFNASNGGGGTLTVDKAATTTTLVSDLPDPSLQGAAFVVTATVAATAPSTGTPTGTVTVSDAVDNCVITLPATTCNLTLSTTGARMLTAQYSGDSNFTASPSLTAAHQVDPLPGGAVATTTTVTALTPQNSVFGQTVGVVVTVTSIGQATGNVTVTAGATGCSAALLPGQTANTATASCNLVSLPVGMTIVSATYAGNANFAPSASSSGGNLTATVAKAATTTTIGTHLPNPSNAGAAITVNAAVTPTPPGAGTPTGTITIVASPGNEQCVITLPNTSCNVTPVAAGGITLSATYSGDVNFNGSVSLAAAHTVNPGGATATTTAVTQVSPTTAVYGQPVQVNVSVTASSGSAAPGGNVNVSTGVGSSCIAVLGASATTTATASCVLSPAPSASANAYTIIASYAGSASFAASSSDPGANGALTVNKAMTTTTITADTPDPSNVNAPVAVTVAVGVVAPGSGTRTGTITVSSNSPNTDQCVITLPATSCNLTLTTTGAKTLTAVYSGDANFSGSTSAGAPHQVNSGGSTPTTATVTIVQPLGSGNNTASATAVFGQPVAVTATVTATSGANPPDGTITLSAGGSTCNVALGAPVGLVSKGTCALSPVSIPASGVPYPVSVGYAGTATFAASGASNGSLTVNKAATTTSITSDTPDPSAAGSPVNVIAQLVVTPPGFGTPSGSIVVTSNPGGEQCTITLPANSCSVTPAASGAKTITAVYGGDANFATSTSVPVGHTVSGGGAVMTSTLVANVVPGTIQYGQPYTVSVSVTALGGATAPNGNVTINVGGSTCTAALGGPVILTSVASCQPQPALAPSGGAYLVTASYAGTPTFAPSSSSAGGNGSLTVTAATPTVSVSAAPSPSFVLTPVQVTATVAAPFTGTPTGTILVSDGSANCTITLPATSCTITLATAGPRTLTATYSGDGNFTGAVSTTSQTVNLQTSFSGMTAVGGVTATATISGSGSCSFVNPQFVPEPVSPPAGIVLPFGMFSFSTTGCGSGGTVTVQIVYSQPIPGASQYWKFGPTPGDASQHWYMLPGASVGGNTVTFSITDGQIGDDDLSANGTIVDQGGPAALVNTAIPTLSESMRAVLALLLAAVASVLLRRRQRG